MQIITTRAELSFVIDNLKKEGKIIGLVPTMGALHDGHISLVKECAKQADITVVSVFVNPTQFNDPKDLERYPRTLENDVDLLKEAGCDIVFAPSVEEVYPEPDTRKFDFGYVESIMEGAKRPGHFNGVGQVVSRLFDLVKPDKAFFGMKDFQQIAIIREMVRQLGYNLEIVSCPIVREEDGLAMSSRNALLTPKHRTIAPHIQRVLRKSVDMASKMDVNALKEWIKHEIDACGLLETEYVEIVDENTLKIVEDLNNHSSRVICVAVYAGEIRLIDNIVF